MFLPFSVFMRGADHLWEVDHYWVTRLAVDQDVEFVEISVNESCASKSNNKIHQL